MCGLLVAFALSLYLENEADRPDHVTELANKGMEHALAGEYAMAEQCWTEALRLEPQEVQLWIYRAMARGMLGNVTGMESDALRAELNCHCAAILVETRTDEAFKYLDQAWKLGKRDAEFHHWRAYAYEKTKKYSEAIIDYHKAILLSPKDVTIRIDLIELLRKAERWEDARDELAWLSKIHFDQEDSEVFRGWLEERKAIVTREIENKKQGSSAFTQSSFLNK
jgi:tetratricopeptide (TPR) repeat protein